MDVAARSRRLVAGIVAVLVIGAAVPGVALAVGATSLDLGISTSTPTYVDTFKFTATAVPAQDYGEASFYDEHDTLIGTVAFSNNVAELSRGGSQFGIGAHSIYATTYGNGGALVTSATVQFTVEPGPSTVVLSGPYTVPYAFDGFSISARMSGTGYQEAGGSVSFYRTGNPTPICADVPLGSWGSPADCAIPAIDTPGTYNFTARFSGTTHLAPSSDDVDVVVDPDPVYVDSMLTQYASIYPVTDGYRDTDKISGSREEAAAILIRIYNSANTEVKSVSYALGTGAYSYAWNGRTSTGSILPEGTYRVLQRATDIHGVSKWVTTYVVLSKKFLHYHTTTITKLGSSINGGGGSFGSAIINYTNSSVKVFANGGYGYAGWTFTMPSATVYKSETFKVEAKHILVSGDGSRLKAEDWTKPVGSPHYCGAGWDPYCFGAWKVFGNSTGSLAWFSEGTLTASAYHSGRTFKGMVYVAGTTHAAYVYKVSLTVVYGVLGY
jgi:hypothetical protein